MKRTAFLVPFILYGLALSAAAPAAPGGSGAAPRFAEHSVPQARSVGFSTDGARMLFHSGDEFLEIWSVDDGKLLKKIKTSKPVERVAISGDGKSAAGVARDRSGIILIFWDLDAGTEVGQAKVKDGTDFAGLAITTDGKRAYVGTISGGIEGWEPSAKTPSVRFGGGTGVPTDLVVDARETRLVSMTRDGTMRSWELPSGKPSWTVDKRNHPQRWIAFSRDGSRVFAAFGDTVNIHDARDGSPKGAIPFSMQKVNVIAGAESPDGKLVAIGSQGGGIMVWDLAAGREKFFQGTRSTAVLALAFRPKRGVVAFIQRLSATEAVALPIIDLAEGVLHPAALSGLAFTDRGKRIVACSGESGTAWSLIERIPRPIVLDPKVGGLLAASTKDALVAFAANGRDGTIILADAARGEVVGKLKGHSYGVHSLAFSPTGKHLASGGLDGTARIWDVASRTEVFQAKTSVPPVSPVGFDPAARRIYFVDKLAEVHCWEIAAKKEVLKFRIEGGLRHHFSVDTKGSLMFLGGDGTPRLFGPDGKSRGSAKVPPGLASAAAVLSADGKLLAVAGDTGVIVLKGPRWTEKLRIETELPFKAVAINPDGTLLAAAGDGGVHLYRIPR